MELLILFPVIGLLAVYVVYREWLNIAYRRWATELDLFKRRLAAYEQLKSAAEGAVSDVETDRFARAMSDMRFLFDDELERLVTGIHSVLLKKQTLDALIEKAAQQEKSPTDQALIKLALEKSRELAIQISIGIYRDVPERMEKFMHSRSLTSPANSASPATRLSSHHARPKLSRHP